MSMFAKLEMEYPILFSEINSLNKAYGWNGIRDALIFIEENAPHYDILGGEYLEFVENYPELWSGV